MLETLFDPSVRPFAVAALVLVGLVVIEIVTLLLGVSASSAADAALDLDTGGIETGIEGGIEAGGADGFTKAPSAALGWLNAGGVPFLVLLMIMLAAFSISGFAIQGAASAFLVPLPWWIASPMALAASLPATRKASRLVARLVPKDETYAVAPSALVGRVGTVTLGPLDAGAPGKVAVDDVHGNRHFVRARVAHGVEPVAQNALALLVFLGEDGVYEAIPAPEELAPKPDSAR